MAVIGIAVFLAYGITLVMAASAGLGLYLATWAVALVITACFLMRIAFPVSISAFFGAWLVWGWHPILAALFVAPGLALIVPAITAKLVAAGIGALRRTGTA